MSGYIKGIDVSEHNGIIDWEKVKTSGIAFAMIRAGKGQAVDIHFKRNVSECNRIGLPIGIYWFSYALSAAGAAREAAVCLETIKPYSIDFPVAFDLEYDNVDRYAKNNGVSIGMKLASEMARSFCRAIQNAGYAAMNYANADYLRRCFDADVQAEFPVWLAQWPNGTPKLDKPPRSCGIWQYSQTGTVPGIKGPVDLNVYYKEMDEMTQEQFNKMFKTAMDAYRADLRDNDNSAWSQAARDFAVENGIFTGAGAGADGTPNFMWEDLMTREQCAQILYRFAQKFELA